MKVLMAVSLFVRSFFVVSWLIISIQSFGDTTFTNVSLGKSTSQSSTGWGGVSSRAVDGNTSGHFSHASVTHTNNDQNAWWQVDLGQTHTISKIKIYNRTDCCSDRLLNFTVYIENDEPVFDQADFTKVIPSVSNSPLVISTKNIQGRYVRIQLNGTNYLSLAEVEVMGRTDLIALESSFPHEAIRIHNYKGKCLEPASSGNGSEIKLTSCNSKSSQLWFVNDYTVVHKDSGRCLDAHAPDYLNEKDGTKAQIWDCNGTQQQRFMSKREDMHIKMPNSLCLAVPKLDVDSSYKKAQLSTCDFNWDNQNQLWYVGNKPKNLKRYQIKNINGKCVVPQEPHSTMKLTDCNMSDSYQDWDLSDPSAIVHVDTGFCMDADVAGYKLTGNGTRLQVTYCNRTEQQHFSRKGENDLIKMKNGLCIDAPSVNNPTNTKVYVWQCDSNNDNQKWKYEEKLAATPRIIGGTTAGPEDNPFQALIEYKSKLESEFEFVCGGSLLDPYTVATVFHCSKFFDEGDYRIKIGPGTRKSIGYENSIFNEIVNVIKVINPNDTGYYVSILKLQNPVYGALYAKIPEGPPEDKAPLLLTGWGMTQAELGEPPLKMLLKATAIYNDDATEDHYTIFTTSYADSGGSPCKGDSGGPLAGNNYLYGIAKESGDSCMGTTKWVKVWDDKNKLFIVDNMARDNVLAVEAGEGGIAGEVFVIKGREGVKDLNGDKVLENIIYGDVYKVIKRNTQPMVRIGEHTNPQKIAYDRYRKILYMVDLEGRVRYHKADDFGPHQWETIYNNPNRKARDIVVNPSNGRVYIATFGGDIKSLIGAPEPNKESWALLGRTSVRKMAVDTYRTNPNHHDHALHIVTDTGEVSRYDGNHHEPYRWVTLGRHMQAVDLVIGHDKYIVDKYKRVFAYKGSYVWKQVGLATFGIGATSIHIGPDGYKLFITSQYGGVYHLEKDKWITHGRHMKAQTLAFGPDGAMYAVTKGGPNKSTRGELIYRGGDGSEWMHPYHWSLLGFDNAYDPVVVDLYMF